MTRRGQVWRWTPSKEAAVPLVADGKVTEGEIATRLAVTRRTVVRWKAAPEFQQRVAALVARATEAASEATIATKVGRLAIYQRELDDLERVFAARAEQYKDIPGGDTGIIVGEPTIVKVYEVADGGAGGAGEDEEVALTPLKQARVVYHYKVDVPLLKERRDLLKQAAIELRQWVERTESTNREGLPSKLDLSQLSDDELAELERLTAKAEAGEGAG